MGKWEMVRLGDVGTFQTGGTPARSNKEYFEGTIPWVSTPSLGATYIDSSNASAFLTADAIKNSATKIIPSRSLLVGIRVGVGKASINTVPMCTNQDIVSISNLNLSIVSPEYLHKCLATQKHFLDSQKRGATILGVKSETLKNIQIPLPPLPVQQKIAAILALVDILIEKRKAQIAKLDLLVKSQFIEMFGDPVTNPMGWEQATINDVCSSIVRGPFGSALKVSFFVPKSESTFKVYEQKNAIQQSAVIGEYYITQKKYEELKRFECKPNDIIMSCSGTIGRFLQIPEESERGIINQALCKFTLNEKMLPIVFLTYMRQSLDEFETKGSGIQNIGAVSFIKSMPVNLPPITIQTRFAELVQATDYSKFEMQQGLDKLELLYKSLMQKCINGELLNNDEVIHI